jgi:hypothetical protein
MIKKTTMIGIILASLVFILAACAGQAPAANAAPAKTPPAQTAGTGQAQQVSAPASEPVKPSRPAGPIKVTEITATVNGDIVSIPVTTVQDKWNVHFLVNSTGGQMGFMAYSLNNDMVVRASICPPCRGKTYTLDGATLVCDTCGTTFDANTGIGKSGACVNYPKASVPYSVSGDNITMKISDLQTAYQNTLKPGRS